MEALFTVNPKESGVLKMIETEHHTLYTIGHSNHTIEHFIGLLKRYSIKLIVDVRSEPYSRYHPQFNKDLLDIDLGAVDISYVFLGDELGARPKDTSCYENGQVSFEKLAERKEFKQAIGNLLILLRKNSTAIMCAEKEPLQCHRTVLVCRELKKHGLCIQHILADGSIENHIDTEQRLIETLKLEPTLFEPTKNRSDIIELAYNRQSKKISSWLEQQV